MKTGFDLSTQSILASSESVKKLRNYQIGESKQVSLWQNRGKDIVYDDILGHTLSYYLQGGHNSYRKTDKNKRGSPKSICVIPEGSYSQWHHSTNILFIHIHLTNQELKSFYAETFNKDARLCALPEMTYEKVSDVKNHFEELYDLLPLNNPALMDEVTNEIMVRLLTIVDKRVKPLNLKGGLSRQTTQRIRDYVESNINHKLTLKELAQVANLSQYHFQRLFQQTFGASPAHWVNRRRIAIAKELLKTSPDCPLSISQIAIDCGFYDQSHFTHTFKKTTGVTPKKYIALIN
ncbi:helix-turn-helix domain-containing protein [Psychrobacter sp. H7-1]|uniref:helix-turn-helix domain-containing protein n=1 Tax=Psychrobacter sp. H7-1 TaxID=1569265 RepID=UPI001919F481|nr:AraC family transcriptional regulator [Psychrobacter sp. H7-1]